MLPVERRELIELSSPGNSSTSKPMTANPAQDDADAVIAMPPRDSQTALKLKAIGNGVFRTLLCTRPSSERPSRRRRGTMTS